VAGGDGGLHLIGPRAAAPQRAVEQVDALADLGGIPPAAVLILQRHQVSGRVHPRQPPRVVQQHQGQQAGRLRFIRHQPGEHPG
jgi:hypothetical protein